MAEILISGEDYGEWPAAPLVDPRSAKADQLIHGMAKIVAVVGPVMASRVFQIASKAGGLNRIYDETKRAFLRALQAAIYAGTLVADQEASDDPATWVIRLPTQPPVRVWTLGSRTLHEVPAPELAEFML